MLTPKLSLPGGLDPEYGNYELVEELGRGGMGVVYRARHTMLDSMVAIKFVRTDKSSSGEDLDRFRLEARNAARVQHQNVVRAFDGGYWNESGWPFLVMELLDGQDVGDLLTAESFSVDEAVEIIRQAALGLQAIGEKGLVHRDIKPSNLFLCADGCIKILDLGLSVLQENQGQLTTTGQVPGTPEFTAPERLDDNPSQVDIRSDLYSLGCTFYNLLVGYSPFRGPESSRNVFKIYSAHCSEPAPPLPSTVPDFVRNCVARLLEKEPSKRYDSPQELADELAETPSLPIAPLQSTVKRLLQEIKVNAGAPPETEPSPDQSYVATAGAASPTVTGSSAAEQRSSWTARVSTGMSAVLHTAKRHPAICLVGIVAMVVIGIFAASYFRKTSTAPDEGLVLGEKDGFTDFSTLPPGRTWSVLKYCSMKPIVKVDQQNHATNEMTENGQFIHFPDDYGAVAIGYIGVMDYRVSFSLEFIGEQRRVGVVYGASWEDTEDGRLWDYHELQAKESQASKEEALSHEKRSYRITPSGSCIKVSSFGDSTLRFPIRYGSRAKIEVEVRRGRVFAITLTGRRSATIAVTGYPALVGSFRDSVSPGFLGVAVERSAVLVRDVEIRILPQ